MTTINVTENNKILDTIHAACLEIQQVLNEHLKTTSNMKYKEDIEKDVVTLENLKHITIAVKKDIQTEQIGASTELLLRIASNDFRNKLTMIPEKKKLSKEIIHSIKEVHSNILRLTI